MEKSKRNHLPHGQASLATPSVKTREEQESLSKKIIFLSMVKHPLHSLSLQRRGEKQERSSSLCSSLLSHSLWVGGWCHTFILLSNCRIAKTSPRSGSQKALNTSASRQRILHEKESGQARSDVLTSCKFSSSPTLSRSKPRTSFSSSECRSCNNKVSTTTQIALPTTRVKFQQGRRNAIGETPLVLLYSQSKKIEDMV